MINLAKWVKNLRIRFPFTTTVFYLALTVSLAMHTTTLYGLLSWEAFLTIVGLCLFNLLTNPRFDDE